MAQHGTKTQRSGLVERVLLGWEDVKVGQQQLALKNTPWLVGAPMYHVRRIDG